MEKSKRTFRGSYPAYALTYFFFYWSLGVFTSVLSMYLTGIGKYKSGVRIAINHRHHALIMSCNSDGFDIVFLDVDAMLG